MEKLLRGGRNTLCVQVTADVCLHCGERLYGQALAESFAAMRDKLQQQEFSHFKALGQSFTIEAGRFGEAMHPAG